MIRTTLFFCSDSAAIDARFNTLSVFHIMEQLNAPAFPMAIPRLTVVALLSKEEADPPVFQLQLQIFLGVQQLFAGPVHGNFFQQLSTRTVIEVNGLVIPAPGELRLVLINGEQPLGSWTVRVNQVGMPAMQLVLPPPAPPQPPPAVQ